MLERGTLLRELGPAASDALLAQVGPDSHCPLAIVQLRHMGGALGRPGALADAVCARDAAFVCYAIGIPTPDVAPLLPAAMGALLAALEPFGTGRGSGEHSAATAARPFGMLGATETRVILLLAGNLGRVLPGAGH